MRRFPFSLPSFWKLNVACCFVSSALFALGSLPLSTSDLTQPVSTLPPLPSTNSVVSAPITTASIPTDTVVSPLTNTVTPLPKTHFLHVSSFKFLKILPPPPKADSKRQAEDQKLLYETMAARTKEQMTKAIIASSDSVFDFSIVLGPSFNPTKYPHLAKLFSEIRDDASVAIHSAKNKFHRPRPDTWAPTGDENPNKKQKGYAYPSGHSTRAFLWATLLAHLFPEQEEGINLQAHEKAWNRVLLGRHYPNDVYAGERYGKYLAEEFLKDPKFEHEWELIQQEVGEAKRNAIGAPTNNMNETQSQQMVIQESQTKEPSVSVQ